MQLFFVSSQMISMPKSSPTGLALVRFDFKVLGHDVPHQVTSLAKRLLAWYASPTVQYVLSHENLQAISFHVSHHVAILNIFLQQPTICT